MKIKTSRFGIMQVEKENEFFFPEGVLGFEDLRTFVLIDDPEDELFIWMQSCGKSHIAFPLLETSLIISKYKIHLSKGDLDALQLKDSDSYQSFSIITIPEDPRQMSANLKAPIILNTKQNRGRQCVLPEEHHPICDPIFSRLSQRLMTNASFSFKSQRKSEWGKTVLLSHTARQDKNPSSSLDDNSNSSSLKEKSKVELEA